MNIEDLNKTQLLLLTLLVNFVTSIATGVLTVSLLDDTSPTITQTVNRIVEHTVDTVTAPPVIVSGTPKPTTSAPTDEERRTLAATAASARTVTVFKASNTKVALATGTYLPKARAVVVASAALPSEIVVSFSDGTSAPASRSRAGSGLTVYGFSDTATLPAATSPTLVSSANVKAGQTVLALLGDGSVSTGIVTKVVAGSVSANIGTVPAGASLLNLDANIVGISNGVGAFVPAEAVTTLLSAPAS